MLFPAREVVVNPGTRSKNFIRKKIKPNFQPLYCTTLVGPFLNCATAARRITDRKISLERALDFFFRPVLQRFYGSQYHHKAINQSLRWLIPTRRAGTAQTPLLHPFAWPFVGCSYRNKHSWIKSEIVANCLRQSLSFLCSFAPEGMQRIRIKDLTRDGSKNPLIQMVTFCVLETANIFSAILDLFPPAVQRRRSSLGVHICGTQQRKGIRGNNKTFWRQ